MSNTLPMIASDAAQEAAMVEETNKIAGSMGVTETAVEKVATVEKAVAAWVKYPADLQAKYSPWDKPRKVSTSTKIGKQWMAVLSDTGYTTARHAGLYPKEGPPKKCVNRVIHAACGIANTLKGLVETIGEGAKLKARVVEIDVSEMPPTD